MKFSFKQIAWGKKRKLDEWAKKVSRLCVHVQILICQPPFLPRNFKDRGGRTRVHAPISQMSGAMFLFIIKFLASKI
jgi:hypothetical protein